VHDTRGMGADIGALVMKVAIVNAQDAAVLVDRGADTVELLA
jgi:hypothetical protein